MRGTGRLIKELNRSRILECLQRGGPLSRVELAERTGISLPAVSKLVGEMEREGLVVSVGEGPSSGGRRPLLFAYNSRRAYVVGLDVGGTKTAAGILDLEGNIVATASVSTHGGSSPADVPGRIKGLVTELLAEAGIDRTKVMGVGIGVPGIPDPEGRFVALAPGLHRDESRVFDQTAGNAQAGEAAEGAGDAVADRDGETSIPLGEYLRQELGCPVYMENDVNAILRGEVWKGALQGVRNAVCVTIGTGIGVGLLINGEVYRGARGSAGEIGYWLIGSLGPIVRSGGYGPLESFAAGPGIARRYVARLKSSGIGSEAAHPAVDDDPVVTAHLVAERAMLGDPSALEVWRETVEVTGVALANLCSLMDPEVLVVGGGVSRAPRSLFLDPVRRIVDTLVPYPPKVVSSQLGEQAGIFGAVATVLDSRRNSISYVSAGVQE